MIHPHLLARVMIADDMVFLSAVSINVVGTREPQNQLHTQTLSVSLSRSPPRGKSRSFLSEYRFLVREQSPRPVPGR